VDRMNHCRDMAIWSFTRWRPAAVFDLLVHPTYRTTHDGALAVLNVLSNLVSIWLIVLKIMKIQFFLRLVWNCLTTPTFWEVLFLWGFDTLNNFFLIETLKSHILGWSRVVWGIDRENPSTRFCCKQVKAAYDLIILSNFGFSIFRGFWSTGRSKSRLSHWLC